MRQAVLVAPKHIEFKEVAAPKAEDLKEHQVLVNIKRIGICGSEIHSYHGLHPATFRAVRLKIPSSNHTIADFLFCDPFFDFSVNH